MARLAIRRQVDERLLARRSRRVTRSAVRRRMRALERKRGHLMRLAHRRHVKEAPRRMTLRTVRAELSLMCVTMARHTVARDSREIEQLVAADARSARVCAFQREAPRRVFELGRDLRRFPGVGEMALRARLRVFAVRISSPCLGQTRPR